MPLHKAAENGYEVVVWLLLEHTADVNVKDNDGWTPLHTAAENGHDGVVQLLLRRAPMLTRRIMMDGQRYRENGRRFSYFAPQFYRTPGEQLLLSFQRAPAAAVFRPRRLS